jgi:hypothetical protein
MDFYVQNSRVVWHVCADGSKWGKPSSQCKRCMRDYHVLPTGAASVNDTPDSLEEEGAHNNRPVLRPSNPEMEPVHIGPPDPDEWFGIPDEMFTDGG